MSEWTLEQATELVFEQMLTLMDGCDDDDSVRPMLVFEVLRDVWSPEADLGGLDDLAAGVVRQRCREAIGRLAAGCLPVTQEEGT